MTKRKKYTTTLIFRGHLAEDLHFGPFCHNWWISRPSEKINNPCLLYPIRIQSKLLVTLNGHDFIIEVGQLESEFGPHPSYICKCDGVQSEICKTPSTAITMVYQKIFQSKTNFSGPEVMGYDTSELVQEYLHELPFQVFNYSFNKLRIWILGVEKSNNENFNFAGPGFKSAFIHSYNRQRSIFFQEVEFSECRITIYTEGNRLKKTFVGCDPNLVWNQVGYLKQFRGDHEYRAWESLLRHVGCVEITPFEKNQSEFRFWSRSTNLNTDKASLATLYTLGFLNPIPKYFKNNTKTFWQCFKDSLDTNACGNNGKCCVLSIIANAFSYEAIKENLKVSNDAILATKKHSHTCGPGGQIKNKPAITYEKISPEKQEQIQQFLTNKANVIMSSYKTDSVTDEPVYYLKDSKNVLWERFREEYPDGMRRTSFYAHLQENQYIYHENLGGLCQTCSKYGYDTFDKINELIHSNIKCHHIQNILVISKSIL
ncbi:hypothetical protein C2G38_2144933 [Gigaspora rosea]|uniref:Uncharacterized protein n=1 Tax=Gigaspora rosea TaxID=44941 RepID=A0A397UVF1_9GLOM|nr:hypothetical protein C2G38_2144933 [Gigaspora rosea]